VALGLIPAPDIPEKIAKETATELPELLGRHIDDRVSWEVPVIVDPLTGSDREAPELLDACHERLKQEGWDLAICLTDLPVYRSGYLVVADVSAQRKVAGLSLPVLGATRLRPRAREAILQLVDELYARITKVGEDDPPAGGEEGDPKTEAAASRSLSGPRPKRLVESRPTELVAPSRRVEPPDEDMKNSNVDARFAAPGALGHLRLWAGMVLAKRPWKLFPSFKGALAAAFATAAYVLVLPTLWAVADALGWARLLALMIAAIAAMGIWIIVGHHLWERPLEREAPHWAALYNGVTALTISVVVLFAYAVLFALVLLAAWVFVPSAYFQSTLKHPVGLGDYLILAWWLASVAVRAIQARLYAGRVSDPLVERVWDDHVLRRLKLARRRSEDLIGLYS
jgi:hypothetical protein